LSQSANVNTQQHTQEPIDLPLQVGCEKDRVNARTYFYQDACANNVVLVQAAKLQQMSLKPKAPEGEGKLEEDDEEVGIPEY